jgi:hypothetical protein
MSDEAIKGPASIFHELWDTFRKLDTKPISDWIALVLKIMGGIGAFLLIAYAAKEHFFYDLSSLAAISLLLLVAFAFSFLVAAAAFYAVVSMIWLPVALFWVISWTTRRFGHPPKVRLRPAITKWHVGFSFFMFLLMGSYILVAASKHSVTFPILHWFALTGFVAACLIVTEPITLTSGSSTLKRLLSALAVPVLLLFLVSGSFSYLLDRSMIILSFRSEPDQYVTLSEQSYRKVDALARTASIPMSACELRKDYWLIKGVTLVWHGIGTTSYLRVTGKPNVRLLIPLPSSDVQAIHADSPDTVGDCAAPGHLSM